MNGLSLTLQCPEPSMFAPYGRLVTPPVKPGSREFYSDALQVRKDASAPVLHVNHVLPQVLPLSVARVERHPLAAQCFFPLDVSRYVVMVMPSDGAGLPCPDQAVGFLMPGSMGVIYHPGVWHLCATVLERPGHFTVLMWRGGAMQDDEFETIPPMTLLEPT